MEPTSSGDIFGTMHVDVDMSDPLVAVLGWALAGVLNRQLGKRARNYRHLIPTLAVLIAVGLRAAYAATLGQPIDAAMLLRALAAGAVAVAGHSQFREGAKFFAEHRVKRRSSAPVGS